MSAVLNKTFYKHKTNIQHKNMVRHIAQDDIDIVPVANHFDLFTPVLKNHKVYMHMINRISTEHLVKYTEKINAFKMTATSTHLTFKAHEHIRSYPESYITLMLYIAFVNNFEDDFRIFRSYSLCHFISLYNLTSLNKAVATRLFYVDLIKAILKTKEDKVFELLKRKVTDWRLIFDSKIAKVFIKAGNVPMLEAWIFTSQIIDDIKNVMKGHKLQNTLHDESIHRSVIDLLNLLSKHQLFDLIKRLFDFFLITPASFMIHLAVHAHESTIFTHIKLFGTPNNSIPIIEKLTERKLFNLLCYFGTNQIAPAFGDDRIRNSILAGLEQSHTIVSVLLTIYKAKLSISSVDTINEIWKKMSEIIDLKFQQSPINMCPNPFKACFLSYLLLDFFNHRLKLKNQDIQKTAFLYLNICDTFLNNLSPEMLLAFFTEKDPINKILFDYIFKVYNDKIFVTSFMQSSIDNFWRAKNESKKVFSFYFNLNLMTKPSMIIKQKFWHSFKIFHPRKTFSGLKYSMFKDSLQTKVLTQIMNTICLLVIEIISIYRVNSIVTDNEASGVSLFSLLYKLDPVVLFLASFMRFSYCLHIVIGLWLSEDVSKVRKLMYVNQAIIMFSLLNIFIFPIFNMEIQKDNIFILTNLRAILSYLLIAKFIMLMLPIPKVGFGVMVLLRLIKQTIIFTVFSSLIFIAIAFILYRMFIDFFSEMNPLKTVYTSILRLYEYSFGAVLFTPIDNSAPEILLNMLLIIFTFFGNVMIVNLYIAYLTTHYEQVRNRALFSILKSQYRFYKLYPRTESEFYYYIPFNLDLAIAPIAYLFCRLGFTSITSKVIKGISHFLQILVPGLVLNIAIGLIMVVIHFWLTWIKMLKHLSKKPARLAFYSVLWLVVGIPFLLVVLTIDLFNFIHVITDYTLDYRVINRVSRTMVSQFSSLHYYSIFKKRLHKIVNGGTKVLNPSTLQFILIEKELKDLSNIDELSKYNYKNDLISLKSRYKDFCDLCNRLAIENRSIIQIEKASQMLKVSIREHYYSILHYVDFELIREAFEINSREFLSDFNQNLLRIKEQLIKLKSIPFRKFK